MNKNILKKTLIILGGIFAFIYILFLILPVLLIPVLDLLSQKTSDEIFKTTGFKAEFVKFRVVTTPKLTFGVKLENAKIYEPTGDLLLDSSNLQVKASLIPLLAKKIELDLISADDINLNIKINPDGTIFIDKYFKKEETKQPSDNNSEFKMPFGFVLSNNLPDIKILKHNVKFIDIKTNKAYFLEGKETKISDFVFNKKIKVETEGKIVLDNFEALDYEIKIFNRLMPDMNFNDAVFAGNLEKENSTKKQENEFNILQFFKQIKDKKIKAELDVDLDTSGNFEKPVLVGEISLDKISMLLNGKILPESKVDLTFEKEGLEIESDIYTKETENIKLTGLINHKKLNLNCVSNVGLENVFEIIKQILKAFSISDFDTMKVSGKLNADFKIDSDYKKIISNGTIKLLSGALYWGLYDVKINNLSADVSLNNNTVLINKLGFETLSVPFTINGKITPDAKLDINVLTNNLVLKSLLVSLGQGAILKDNPIYSGLVSIKAKISGNALSPFVSGNVDILNLKLKNIPSDIILSFSPLNLNLKTTEKGFTGTAKVQNAKLVNPAVTFSVPALVANLDENKINIQKTKAYFGKNEFQVSGTVSDYLKEKVLLDFITEGKLNSSLNGYINPYKMLIGLNYSISDNSEIIIPMFDKSKVKLSGSTAIEGSMLNPILKGRFIAPSISIPEVPVNMTNSIFSLDGQILNGSMTISDFTSGGIKANGVSSDFELKGNDFYLKNLKGSAFSGEFAGDVLYNLKNTLCKVVLNGDSMNALKAIEGAAGIKNALTGTLSFNSNINFKGVEYNDMMKSLKGSADFEIKNGVLANLGGLKTLLYAKNIVNNVILKQAADKVSSLDIIQQTSEFNYIKGDLSFSGGYANLDKILMQGPKMAYYITGKFNLISADTDAIILGRLSGDVVSVLGNIGDLATNTISSLIPGLGSLTSSLAKLMNETPKNIDTSKIPVLSSQSETTKDFKAVFDANANSSSPVKSFKWLNDVDTSSIDVQNSSSGKNIQDVKENIKQNVDNTINGVKTNLSNSANLSKENLDNAKEQAKLLFNSLLNRTNETKSE